jgi:hypothetical protein
MGLDGDGDFNGDGQPDIAIGNNRGNSFDGRIAVLYGDVGTINPNSPASGQGFTLDGVSASGEYAGGSLSISGDVNGDGLRDLIVGAYGANNSAYQSGSAYLIFGRSDIPNTGATLAAYANGTDGIRIDGSLPSGNLGWSTHLGDVNGDTCADIILGQPYNGNGRAFVIFGGSVQ